MSMENSGASPRVPTRSKVAWPLVACWLLGAYLIVTNIAGGMVLASNWATIQGMQIMDPHFNIAWMIAAWFFKLLVGVLFIARSRWVMAAILVWIGLFVVDFGARTGFSHLPSAFFLACALQGCILSFAVWMHGRGALR